MNTRYKYCSVKLFLYKVLDNYAIFVAMVSTYKTKALLCLPLLRIQSMSWRNKNIFVPKT